VLFCRFLVDIGRLVRNDVGTGRGVFLFGIGMVEPNAIGREDICAAYTAAGITPNGRPGLRRVWYRYDLADKEESDGTVAVDGRMQNPAGGMSKEYPASQHVCAEKHVRPQEKTWVHLVEYSHAPHETSTSSTRIDAGIYRIVG